MTRCTPLNWLKQLLARRRLSSELSQELRAHLEEKIEDLVARGTPRREAEYQARREFGNLTLTEQDSRAVWRWPRLEDFLLDLRFAFRLLRRSPGFTAVAILTLALGIGVNTAVFGLVDSALLHALAVSDPQRLVHVWTTDAGGDLHTPLPAQFLALRKFSQSFQQVAGIGWVDNFYGSDGAGWQSLPGVVVTSNLLDALGIQPVLGRNFLDEEQTPGHDDVALLSYGCWRTRFQTNPSIVGKRILLNRRSVSVIGVLPQSLGTLYGDVEVFAPLVLDSYLNLAKLRIAGSPRVHILARLKPGVALDQARSETEAIAQGLRPSAAAGDRSGHLVLEGFVEASRNVGPTLQNARRGLWIAASAAGTVLLIACANVASLLLARGVRRHRETAVRSALGCSRGRMIRQLLTETVLLFAFGGALALLAAHWSRGIIGKLASGMVSNFAYIELNWRVFAATIVASLVTALLFGMIPALHATRANLNATIKTTSLNASPGSRRPRNLLVASQIALGMVLLVAFGLLFRSLLHVESAPFGFDPRDVLTSTVSLPVSRYNDPSSKARLLRAAMERIHSLPGVESAGATDSLPMEGADSARITLQASSTKAALIDEEIFFVSVSPEYFSTLKIPMSAGRSFQEQDREQAAPVAIINRTFANTYFAGANPVGAHIALADSPATWREIVGVVSDFRQRNPEEDLRPMVYLPFAQTLPARWSMVIRLHAASDLGDVAQRVRNSLRVLDPQLYWQTGSMPQEIHDSESLTLRRPIIALSASFGALALVLVVVGVFGVASYSVAERTQEIGIRVALGAARQEIAALVFRESLAVTLLGLLVGSVIAFALSRFLPTTGIGWSGSGIFLFGVSRTDSVTYTLSATLLTAVVLVASWIPARRATRVDPLLALRHE
jgi:putative ABC transport system permease protein